MWQSVTFFGGGGGSDGQVRASPIAGTTAIKANHARCSPPRLMIAEPRPIS
jgi:hypothetical protein